ncbi:MAG: host attachment protein [Methylocella sp.]
MHHKLAHGAWVFVGDGQKALFLINEGDEKFPNLRRLAVEEHKDPHHANSSDAPGCAYSSADGGRGENIAGTANRLDQARVARIRCGLLAQPHHLGRHPGRNQPISDP